MDTDHQVSETLGSGDCQACDEPAVVVEFSEVHWYRVRVHSRDLLDALAADDAPSLEDLIGREPPTELRELLHEAAAARDDTLDGTDGCEIGKIGPIGF